MSLLFLALLAGCGTGLTRYGDTGDTALTLDTGDTSDTGRSLGGTGTSGLVEFDLLQVACPSCFGATSSLTVTASAAFHDPVPGSWIAWMPPVGGCAFNTAPVPLATSTRDVGQWVYLQSGSKSIGLLRTTASLGTIYQKNDATESDFVRNAAWDVVIPDADPTETIQGGLQTTEGFDAIQPIEMLYTQPAAAFSAAISRQGQQFTWSPSGSGDFFVVLVDVYDASGSTHLGSVMCRGPDNGSLAIPSAGWSPFPPGSLLAIGLYRYRHNVADVPDGSVLESVSSDGVLGTGTLY